MHHNWSEFLKLWNLGLVIAAKEEKSWTLPDKTIASGWFGHEGATASQIVAAETRLGVHLPPSYREFLQVTNGWEFTGSFIYKFWPVEELELYAVRNQWRIDVQYDDPRYPYDPIGSDYPPSIHMKASLELSADGDAAVVLLDPLVITSDGEWQVHFMADWIPGATRFNSFWDFMQHECAGFLDNSGIDYIQAHPDIVVYTTKPDVTILFEACYNLIRSAGTLEDKSVSYNNAVKTVSLDIIARLQNLVDQPLRPDAFMASLLVLAEHLIDESRDQYFRSHSTGDAIHDAGIKDTKRIMAKMIRHLLWPS